MQSLFILYECFGPALDWISYSGKHEIYTFEWWHNFLLFYAHSLYSVSVEVKKVGLKKTPKTVYALTLYDFLAVLDSEQPSLFEFSFQVCGSREEDIKHYMH